MNRHSKRVLTSAAAALSTAVMIGASHADDLPQNGFTVSGGGHPGHGVRADGHAPIGVMGDHLHNKGEWMLSYRFMRMNMEGNRIGTDEVSPETIVTTVPNRFANPAIGQPPTLRVVPTEMVMDMHMLGAMYAPTNDLTLMATVPFIRKEMDHITFRGPAGTVRRGTFTTKSEGVGDIKLSGLFRLYDGAIHHVHLNMGISAPTGAVDEEDQVLTPTGATPTLRLPYAMQLGSGTWDLLPGITYNARVGDLSWGAQYRAEVRLESENGEGYALGDKQTATGWVAYQWAPWISTSLRTSFMTQDSIDGIDAQIVAPAQTANPDNYGGERLDILGGVNLIVPEGALKGNRFALEVGVPVYQDLNGPQMEIDWTLMVGWQKAF